MEGHYSACVDSASDDEREYMKHQLRREIDLDMTEQSLKGKMDICGTLGVKQGSNKPTKSTHNPNHSDGMKGVAVNHWMYTQEQANDFAALYSCYFEAVMGVMIKFMFTPASIPYVSMLEACRARDSAIVNLITHRPVIWDIMGGSGTDSVGFLCNMYPEALVLVNDCYVTEQGRAFEFECVRHNIQEIVRAFPILDDVRIEFHSTTARDFILLERNRGVHVTILFIDPCWFSGRAADTREMEPEELLALLHEEVFAPIKQNKIQVDFYILKTRWAWEKIAGLLGDSDLSTKYHPVLSIMAQPLRKFVDEEQWEREGQTKGRYHYVVLMHSDLREDAWVKSDLYKALRERQPFTVDTRTFSEPFQPRYSEGIQYHDIAQDVPVKYAKVINPPAKPQKGPSRGIHKAGKDKKEDGWEVVKGNYPRKSFHRSAQRQAPASGS